MADGRKTALQVLQDGEHAAYKELVDALEKLIDRLIPRVVFLEGVARGSDLRIEALEKRAYKLEDVVNEILRRGAGVGTLVQASDRPPDSEQLPSDHNGEGGAVETGDGVSVSPDGGEAVKRNT